jgi:cytochrome c
MKWLAAIVPALLAQSAQAQPASDPWQACAACHSGGADAPGPSLEGIVGRPAASLPDFRYSGPMRRSGIVWTEDRLRAFIVDPQGVVPGNRMPFAGATPQDAVRIVARLRAGGS